MVSTLYSLADAAARPDWSDLDSTDVPLQQHSLSHAIDEAVQQELLSSAPYLHSQALVLSSGLPHAGYWLNVVPSVHLGLHIHGREFRRCLFY